MYVSTTLVTLHPLLSHPGAAKETILLLEEASPFSSLVILNPAFPCVKYLPLILKIVKNIKTISLSCWRFSTSDVFAPPQHPFSFFRALLSIKHHHLLASLRLFPHRDRSCPFLAITHPQPLKHGNHSFNISRYLLHPASFAPFSTLDYLPYLVPSRTLTIPYMH